MFIGCNFASNMHKSLQWLVLKLVSLVGKKGRIVSLVLRSLKLTLLPRHTSYPCKECGLFIMCFRIT